MIEYFIQFDYATFEWIHYGLRNEVLDAVFPLVRDKYMWIPLYVFLIAYFLINFGKRGGIYIVFAFATAGIADYTSSSIVKPAVERIRPCKNADIYHETLVDCGSGYSFTSSHATNHMAVALFIILTTAALWGYHRWWFFLWALSIGFAQVYVGVHYPLDVLGGFVLGGLISGLVYTVYIRIFPNMYFNRDSG